MLINKNESIVNMNDFEVLWDLPSFPLTEKFGKFEGEKAFSFDQSLVINRNTGHVELANKLSPKSLYSEVSYNFRTSQSGSSIRHLNKFCKFFETCIENEKKYRVMVDIGGNDLATIKKLQHKADIAAIIDPICAADDNKIIDSVKVIGKFIENVDLSVELDRPDLVICRHTIEHIINPGAFLTQLFEQCDDDCLFVFELPCFSSLLGSMRLDAIFHQHVNYFDIFSFRALLDECGGEYVSHDINYQGPCGGALFVCFRKRKTKSQKSLEIDVPKKVKFILDKVSCYKAFMQAQGTVLENMDGKIFGYGAGLMAATLAYHMKFDMANLECILDDDPLKNNGSYKNINVLIKATDEFRPSPNQDYLITSLENIRPIYKRILELEPKRIVVPCLVA
jgi:cyclopropane-fatty-acyl-phospholipid synthase